MSFITSDEFNGILVYMKSHLTYCQINDVIKEINKAGTSLVAQWLASTCRCRGHGFDPWLGKIPHAMEQLSPCATTTEPVLQSLRATTTEAYVPTARALQREGTAMRSPRTATKSSPCSPQLKKAHAQQRRPNAAKN